MPLPCTHPEEEIQSEMTRLLPSGKRTGRIRSAGDKSKGGAMDQRRASSIPGDRGSLLSQGVVTLSSCQINRTTLQEHAADDEIVPRGTRVCAKSRKRLSWNMREESKPQK